MTEIVDQFLQLLQRGVAAIFRFAQLVWSWSSEQIAKMMQAPWDQWPLWKQVVLVVVIVAVAYALFVAASRLWIAAMHVLGSFASLLAAFVLSIPSIFLAGAIALGGLWLINNFNPSSVPAFTGLDGGRGGSSNDEARPPERAAGSGARETTGSGGGR
jgi:hypothetical protein